MRNKKTDKFLKYVNTPLSKESVSLLYAANNIKYDRCIIYLDFILTLMILIDNTYMGDELTKGDDVLKHFDWCWYKTIEMFSEEDIFFDHSKELYDYFLNFMLEVYYGKENKIPKEEALKNIIKHWNSVFGYNNIKTQAEVDMFIELYHLFDKTL